MDVILLQDIERVGREGTVVKVKPGFARNYLLPHGLAVAASPEQLRLVEARQQHRQQRQERARADADALKHTIEATALSLPLKVGADNKPFGSITSRDVAKALQQRGLAVEKHDVRLAQPIKALGTVAVPVHLHADVTATLTIQITKA